MLRRPRVHRQRLSLEVTQQGPAKQMLSGGKRFGAYALGLVVAMAPKGAAAEDVTVRIRTQTGNTWTKDHLAPFEIQIEGAERILAKRPNSLVGYSCSVKTPEGRLVQGFIGYARSDAYMPMEVMRSRNLLQAFGEARSSASLSADCTVKWGDRLERTLLKVATPQNVWAPETSISSIAWVPCSSVGCVASLDVELKSNHPPGDVDPRTLRCGVQSILPKGQEAYFLAPLADAGAWTPGPSELKHRFTLTTLPKVDSPHKRVFCTLEGGLEPSSKLEVLLETPGPMIPKAFADIEISSIGTMGTRVLGRAGCTRCDYGITSTLATRSFELKVRLKDLTGPASVSATCTSPLGTFAGAGGTSPAQSKDGAISLRMTGAMDAAFDGGDMLSPRAPLDSQKLGERTPTNVRCVARAIPPFTESKPVEGTVQWGPWTPSQ